MRFANTAYHGPKAVDGVGRARDKVLTAFVLVGVGAHDNDLGVVLGGGLIEVVLVVNGLAHGHKAVGGAERARDEVLAAVVLVGVDAHGDDLRVVLGRGGVDDLLGAAVDDGLSGLLVRKMPVNSQT